VRLVGRRRRPRSALSSARAARRGLGRGSREKRGASKAGEQLIQIVGSRSLLVDVHLLGGRD